MELESRVRQLFARVEQNNGVPPDRLLDSLDNVGTDDVVHLLVRDPRWTHMHHYGDVLLLLMDHIRHTHRNVDSLDCSGMTALEISVRADNTRAMNILVGSDASLDARNSKDQTPLEVALRYSSDVRLIAELLRRSREIDPTYAAIDKEAQPLLNKKALRNLHAILSSSGAQKERDDAYYVIEQLVLRTSRGRKYGKSRETIRQMLVDNWKRPDRVYLSEVDGQGQGFECLRELLSRPLDGRETHCKPWMMDSDARCDCEDAFAIAVFHTCDRALVDAVIGDASSEHLRYLTEIVLAPCPDRGRACDMQYLSGVLRRMVALMDDTGSMLQQKLLAHTMSKTPDDMKATFWKIVIDWRTSESLGEGYASIAIDLTRVSAPACWEMAELVLPYDGGFPSSQGDMLKGTLLPWRARLFLPLEETNLRYYFSNEYLDYLCQWTTAVCRARGDKATGRVVISQATESCDCHAYIKDDEAESHDFWGCAALWAVKLQRCVIHVITKDLCKRESLFAPEEPLSERMQSALQLRQQFELPALEIEPSILLQALNGTGVISEQSSAIEEDVR